MSQLDAGKLSQFKPIKRNSNKHTVRGLAALDHSIEDDGYVAPMTAAADGTVLDGNARLERSFEKLGDDAIIVHHDGTKPIVMVRDDIPDETDPRAKSIHYRANTVQWLDFALDSSVVMADIEAGFDFDSIDVSLPDLGKLLERDVAELLGEEAGNIPDIKQNNGGEIVKIAIEAPPKVAQEIMLFLDDKKNRGVKWQRR